MEHILDNPIYHALSSGNKIFSRGNDRIRYFSEKVSPFVGLKEYSTPDFNSLYRISPDDSFFILFSVRELEIPDQWEVNAKMEILQMVCDWIPPVNDQRKFIPLQERNVPAMLALTKMTNPGPFYSETIRFGNYRGIFDGERLVAMAGQRLHPEPYMEISAVCTDPEYSGRGYAGMLVTDQIHRIAGQSEIPFLHVLKENKAAIKLYEKLGFSMRMEVTGYAIKKLSEK